MFLNIFQSKSYMPCVLERSIVLTWWSCWITDDRPGKLRDSHDYISEKQMPSSFTFSQHNLQCVWIDMIININWWKVFSFFFCQPAITEIWKRWGLSDANISHKPHNIVSRNVSLKGLPSAMPLWVLTFSNAPATFSRDLIRLFLKSNYIHRIAAQVSWPYSSFSLSRCWNELFSP